METQVRKLSLGQRMKCEIVASLLHNPKVLFLDEPTIGLDVVMQKNMRDFVKSYNKEFNSTIILTSHYMDDVKELCKRVIIVDQGQILFDGNLQDVINTYARNKIIKLVLSKKVTKKELSKYGDIREYEYPKVRLNVDRKKAPNIAGKMLQKLPVKDVNIEEPSIEAIIREVFTGKMKSK